jgi:hypothetical protein
MAKNHDIYLAIEDLCRAELLPPICARCGRVAAGMRNVRVTSSEARQPSFLAYLLWELGLWSLYDKEWYENLEHELRITKGRVKMPVCGWHRWFVPPSIGVRLVTKSRVSVSGLSDEFADALRKKGWVAAAPQKAEQH